MFGLTPRLFRWVLSDFQEELATKREAVGQGRELQSKVLTHLAWADDLRLHTESLEDLNAMLTDLAAAALEQIGPQMRWVKCSFAKVSPGTEGVSACWARRS